MFAILLYPLLLLSLIPNRERSFVALNGFAELTPGMLTIPMIKGQGADSAYFDLDKGEIGGKIVDKSQSGKDENISTMLSGFTSIDGGLILTDTIKLQQAGKETSGVSGSNKVAFWAGGKLENVDTKGSEPKVMICHDGSAKVGCFNVDGGGAVSVCDNGGTTRLQFLTGNMPQKSEILNDYDSGYQAVSEFGGNGTGVYYSSETVKLKKNNETLTVTGTLNVSAYADSTDRSSIIVDAELYAVSGSTRIFIASGTAKAGEQLGKWSDLQLIPYNKTTINVPAGIYHLQLEVTTQSVGTRTIGGAITSATISYSFLNDDKKQTILGLDGLSITSGAESYLYCSPAGNNQTFLEIKGKTNMPGVLAKARVDSIGRISRKWGKDITKVENITGQSYNRRILIEKIIGDYSVVCTPYGGGAMPVIYNETPEYVELYANGSFNIMLIGDNR